MITKKEYCELMVEREVEALEITREQIPENLGNSSTLAVCAEFLGLLEVTSYSKQRGGTVLVGFVNGNVVHLSVRELIELLPERHDDNDFIA